MKKASIIVPIYNKAPLLDRCITSVLSQRYSELELLLIDDGSADDSYALCCGYAAQDSRVKAVTQPNGGVSVARNTGLDLATGEYVLFLDADDWWEPGFLETILQTPPGADTLAMCGMYYASPSAKRPVLFDTAPVTQLGIDGIYPIYQKHFLNMIWNKVFLRQHLAAHNIRFQPGLSWGEDKLFVLEYMAHITHIRVVNQPLYNYSVSDTGLDNCFKKDELQRHDALHQALFAFERQLPCPSAQGHLMLCREYVQLQLKTLRKLIRRGRSLRYTAYLAECPLFATCLEELHQANAISPALYRLATSRPFWAMVLFTFQEKSTKLLVRAGLRKPQ